MEKSEIKGFIAKRCAKELKDGDVVNLGYRPAAYLRNLQISYYFLIKIFDFNQEGVA